MDDCMGQTSLDHYSEGGNCGPTTKGVLVLPPTRSPALFPPAFATPTDGCGARPLTLDLELAPGFVALESPTNKRKNRPRAVPLFAL